MKKKVMIPLMTVLLAFAMSGCYVHRPYDPYYNDRYYHREYKHKHRHHHHDYDRDDDRYRRTY